MSLKLFPGACGIFVVVVFFILFIHVFFCLLFPDENQAISS